MRYHSLTIKKLKPTMNVARRIAALKREIGYRKAELDRIEQMRAVGDPAVTALPDFMSKYIANINAGITEREAEVERLEGHTPKRLV
jgi:uncharacterized small protein (DUF1192 family)